MSTKRLFLVILLLLMGCQQAGISQDEPVRPAGPPSPPTADEEADTRLQLYRQALTDKGSKEQMRISAADLLLFSEKPLAREILLSVLKQSENGTARAAVCKALSQAEAARKAISQREDFIKPLLDIVATEEDFAKAKPIAEALLIFDYEQIAQGLEKIVTDVSLPAKARLNAVYALKLHPDMRAAIKLVRLIDDSDDREIAAAAEQALLYWGIPTGKDPEARRQIIAEIELKGNEAFLRNRLIRQGEQMRKLETERNLLRWQYLVALDEIYDSKKDDSAKGKFLAEHLGSSEAMVKLWALEKVEQLRVGTSKLPAELGPILVNLLPDQNRDVRLKTAKVLSLMGELNSAEKLLEQHRIEQDDEVRTEIFVALGVACSYASLPTSPVKISPDIRKQTLGLAAQYLSERDPEKSQSGAAVIKELLKQKQNGLTSADAEVGRYLGLLAERYEQEMDKTDGALRGELLGKMAGLCAQGSACKVEADKLFGPLFEKALGDETDLVREAAVDGLIYIGKTKVLIRKGDLLNDSSIEIRRKLVNLVGEIGGKEDLVRLWEKTGSTVEGDSAWEAMLKIFKRSEAAVLAEWIGKLDLANPDRLSDEQKLSVLEIAEQKAVGEDKAKMLEGIRERLAQVHKKNGRFEQAARYLGMLLDVAETTEEKESILPDLLDVYLRWPNVEMAAKLVDNCLLREDLEPNSPVVLSIEHYLSEPPAGADPNAVLKELLDKIQPIGPADERPKWQEQLKRWTQRLGWAKEPDKSEKPDN